MCNFFSGLVSALVFGALAMIAAFALYVVLVWMPVALWTEAQCLERGYPKSQVSVTLSRYCTTLDGAVTVKVAPLNE